MPERVGGVVGREAVVVERVWAAPPVHEAASGLEPQPDLPGHEALRLVHERIERPPERRVPEPVVDELGVPRLEASLLVVDVALERDVLEVRVREQQRQRRRALVGLTALDPDPTVLDHVEPSPAVRAHDAVHLRDQVVEWQRRAVERDGLALLERDDDLTRLGGRRHGHRPHAGRRRCPRILHLAALDRSTPEVVVDRVQLLLRRRDRDVVPVRVEDRVLTSEAPVTHRREHLEIGSERPHADLEPHLVVALARAAVSDRVGTPLPGREHEVLRDDRPRERRDERVLPLVLRVRLQTPE